ncbi:chondroitin sulfate glucuronyltransferase-like, partial [Leptodactylus fuscus]|uniref:chondroitin sulfate glucuronyltransferase-like n=1 Tax=Leptodactylus fuscus TaxID=238119 RepID=UPI003F4F3B5A
SEIQNLSSFTPDQHSALSWPVGVNPPFSPTSRFDLLTWEYFTEMHTFSCPDGAPKCPLQGVWLLDVRHVLEEALEQLNQRYHPWLRFRKRRLLNGYRRFDPTRGMEYTLELLLEATTEKGHVGFLTKRLSLLRPLGLVEILPMPYVTEATRVQLVLPLTPSDSSHIAGFLDAFATNLLDPQENVALTVLLVYDVGSSGQEKDVYEEVRAMLSELGKRYSYLLLEVSSVRTELPSQVRLMEVVSKKHSMDVLFFLVSVWSEVTTEALNRCRMNAINAWQVFSPVHYQEYSPEVSRHSFSAPQSGEFLRDGHFDRLASSEFCFYNSDFMRARSRMAAEVQEEEDEDIGGIELLELFLRYSDLHVFRALEPALVQRFSLRKCSTRLSGEGYHRCVLSNLEALGSRLHLAMALFDQDQTNST